MSFPKRRTVNRTDFSPCSFAQCLDAKNTIFSWKKTQVFLLKVQGMCLPKRVLKRDARFLSEDYFHLLGHFPS